MFSVIAVVVALAVVPLPAQATHEYDGMMPTSNYLDPCDNNSSPFDSDLEVCRTDNSNWYWYSDSGEPGELEGGDYNSLQDVLFEEYVPTDLVVVHDTSPVFSGGGETDVIFQESESEMPLPSGALGVTWCDDAVNGETYECDQTYVRIDAPDGYRIYDGAVACHEAGHAVGLVHGNLTSPVIGIGDNRLGCMVTGEVPPSNLGSDSTHIVNTRY